ncbi:MAG: nucleotide exchange factor GrpE [Microthrixaceae bacterium]
MSAPSDGAAPGGDPLDEEGIAVGEVVDDPAGDVDDAAARLTADLDATAAGADRLEQTAEEAVAEAVEVAQRLQAERDELRDLVQRVQADFANYKRRVDGQRTEQRAQAALDLVRELLPVLDAGEAALAQGHEDVAPVHGQLLGTLEKLGLSKVDSAGDPFDPNVHEAVLHEEGDGDAVVAEVLRAGYVWNSQVVRPAMVKVRG